MRRILSWWLRKKEYWWVIVAKNRHGETGNVELVWFGQVQKFADKVRSINKYPQNNLSITKKIVDIFTKIVLNIADIIKNIHNITIICG